MIDSYLITENNLEVVAAPIKHIKISSFRNKETVERIFLLEPFVLLMTSVPETVVDFVATGIIECKRSMVG